MKDDSDIQTLADKFGNQMTGYTPEGLEKAKREFALQQERERLKDAVIEAAKLERKNFRVYESVDTTGLAGSASWRAWVDARNNAEDAVDALLEFEKKQTK